MNNSTAHSNTIIGKSYQYQHKDSNQTTVKMLVIVIAFHAFVGYLLVSGMARKGLNFIKKPLEAVVIQEVIIPPPPPPPPPPTPKKLEAPKDLPKVEAAPPPFVPPPDAVQSTSSNVSIASTNTVPISPVAIAPPPTARSASNRNDISVACPTQVSPITPQKAIQDGIEGVVRAQIRIKGGVVQDVTMTGPRVFYAAVKAAVMQYKCISEAGGEIVATQEFNFKFD